VGRWRSGRCWPFAPAPSLAFDAADADCRIEALPRSPCRAGGSHGPGLEQSLERRERALSLTSLPGPRTQGDALSLGRSRRARIRTQNGHWPGNWRPLSLQLRRCGQLPGGARPDLNPARQQRVPTALPALMAPAAAGPTALGYAACLIDGRSRAPEHPTRAPLALRAAYRPGPVLLQCLVRRESLREAAAGGNPGLLGSDPAAGSRGACAGLAVLRASPYLWATLTAVAASRIWARGLQPGAD